MGRKKKKQLKPWCWYPSVWDAADAESWVGEGSGAAWRGRDSLPFRCVPRWGSALLPTLLTVCLGAWPCSSPVPLGMGPGPCPSCAPRTALGPLPAPSPRPRPPARSLKPAQREMENSLYPLRGVKGENPATDKCIYSRSEVGCGYKRIFLKLFFLRDGGKLSICNCCIMIRFNFLVSRNTGGFLFDRSLRMYLLLWSDYKFTFSRFCPLELFNKEI